MTVNSSERTTVIASAASSCPRLTVTSFLSRHRAAPTLHGHTLIPPSPPLAPLATCTFVPWFLRRWILWLSSRDQRPLLL